MTTIKSNIKAAIKGAIIGTSCAPLMSMVDLFSPILYPAYGAVIGQTIYNMDSGDTKPCYPIMAVGAISASVLIPFSPINFVLRPLTAPVLGATYHVLRNNGKI